MHRRIRRRLIVALIAMIATAISIYRYDLFEKRVAVVAEGRLIRGAWQRPWPLRRLIARERVRTIVTLTAINDDDPKYVDQARVVAETGVDWIIVPMRGSTATLEQLAEASDLMADPTRQPVFFHCVAGHHRTNLAMAAYRVRHDQWSSDRAWAELRSFPWTRAEADASDRRLIEAFAASRFAQDEEVRDVSVADGQADRQGFGDPVHGDPRARRLAMDDGERRHR